MYLIVYLQINTFCTYGYFGRYILFLWSKKKKIKLDEKCKYFILYFDDFFSSTYIDTVVRTLCFKILAMEAKI